MPPGTATSPSTTTRGGVPTGTVSKRRPARQPANAGVLLRALGIDLGHEVGDCVITLVALTSLVAAALVRLEGLCRRRAAAPGSHRPRRRPRAQISVARRTVPPGPHPNQRWAPVTPLLSE